MRKVLFLSIVVFAIWSCTENKDDELEPSDLVIKTGTVCGWCAQNDTLTISGKSFRYVNYLECRTTNPSVKKTGQLEASELESLVGKLDFAEFKKLELNSCNVCVDGCDDWITITKDSEVHSIRFGRSDSKLQSIKSFVDHLSAIKAKYEAGK